MKLRINVWLALILIALAFYFGTRHNRVQDDSPQNPR